jgi:hypothetical protein
MQAVGAWFGGPAHGVGLDLAPRRLSLAPAARVVHVVQVDADTTGLLAPWASAITAIGIANEGALSLRVCHIAPGARRSVLGRMQRPPLDGPVDLRGSQRLEL